MGILSEQICLQRALSLLEIDLGGLGGFKNGVVLGALGAYKPLVDIFHSGATVALTGFGAALAEGVKAAVEEKGLLGALTGGVTAMAAGLTAALTLSVICALIFRSKRKTT